MRVDGLLLRSRRWRGDLQVYLTPEQSLNDWIELSLLLTLLAVPEHIERRSDYSMTDVARWLRLYFDRIQEAFSAETYPSVREQLEHVYQRDRLIAKHWKTEINRRLYPEK